ncbi:glycosyltransferase family 4 protein [Chondrinema litorale]|uniref:glycosyltransferase family 4 protein n=1 Tax=Chondrinema litorale TaxID=2994555 RepID=UPI0025428752|nr:MraY family glycosyltransferase [Chondrinema litorale]UZR94353.1 MraY family glycosyltransferase [Chondrinema litorale]
MTNSILIITTSFIIALLLYPSLIRLLIYKLAAVDVPDARKMHKAPKPSMGGILFFLLALVPVLVYVDWELLNSSDVFLVAALFSILLVGFYDDLYNLRARYKLLFFVPAIAFLLFGAGIRITNLNGIIGINQIDTFSSYGLTIFAVIALSNAFNLIDGIDGLAASVGLVACGVLGYLLYNQGFVFHGLLLFGVVGTILAFIKFNWQPSKIFMGDTGSLFLGFLITASLIRFVESSHLEISTSEIVFINPITFALAVLIIPFFDTFRVFTIRIINGRSPFDPDKNHLHHLLIQAGFNHARATLILLASNVLFILLAFALKSFSDTSVFYIVFVLGLTSSVSLHFWVYKNSFENKRKIVLARIENSQLKQTISKELQLQEVENEAVMSN